MHQNKNMVTFCKGQSVEFEESKNILILKFVVFCLKRPPVV